jgi:hypothetical protein
MGLEPLVKSTGVFPPGSFEGLYQGSAAFAQLSFGHSDSLVTWLTDQRKMS